MSKLLAGGVYVFLLNVEHAVQCEILCDDVTESRLLGLVECAKEHA